MGLIITYRAQGDHFKQLDIQAENFDEATLQTGHGIYTVFRVYPGARVVRLEHQFRRLRRSAELLNQPYPISDEWLRGVLRHAVETSGIESPRLRLSLLSDAPDTAVIILEPFNPPDEELYEKGTWVGLVNMQREIARAKYTRFIEQRSRLEKLPGMNEILMVDNEGFIREGCNSNFYAVLDGELRTPDTKMLRGIARGMVLDVAPEVLPVNLGPIHVDDLTRIDEAMLSSASRRIMPVVKVGEVMINGGKPGEIYRQLIARYDALVEAEMETL